MVLIQSGKRTGTKSVALTISKYAPCGVFPRVHYYRQVSNALSNYLKRYSSFCVLAPFWNNLWRHQSSNLHSAKWISLEGKDISQKKKSLPFVILKGLLHKLQLFFLLHRHFKDLKTLTALEIVVIIGVNVFLLLSQNLKLKTYLFKSAFKICMFQWMM